MKVKVKTSKGVEQVEMSVYKEIKNEYGEEFKIGDCFEFGPCFYSGDSLFKANDNWLPLDLNKWIFSTKEYRLITKFLAEKGVVLERFN